MPIFNRDSYIIFKLMVDITRDLV